MKAKNLIIIFILFILFITVLTLIFTNTSQNTNSSDINLTNIDDNATNITLNNSNSSTYHEPYTRDFSGCVVNEDEYYDNYDYGDNYDLDYKYESGEIVYYDEIDF